MISKRSTGCDLEDVPPAKGSRLGLADLFLSNQISGARAARLFADAHSASLTHRDVVRRLLKGSTWPKPYIQPSGQGQEQAHEATRNLLFPVLRRECLNPAEHLSRAGMDPIAAEHLDRHVTTLGIPREVLGVGLWIDGVTTKWDRSRSTDMITFSCPALDGEWHNLRIPLMAVDHGWVMKGSTFNDLLQLVAWSLRFCAMGIFPIARHDGSVWLPSDVWRRKRASKPCQITGKWKFYKDVFRLPQQNESAGCCFKCCATPHSLMATGASARLASNGWDVLTRVGSITFVHGSGSQPACVSSGLAPRGRLGDLCGLDRSVEQGFGSEAPWLHACKPLGRTVDLSA